MSSVTCGLLADCEVEYKHLITNALMGLRPEIKDLDAINKKMFDATCKPDHVAHRDEHKHMWVEIGECLKPILPQKDVAAFVSRAMNSHFQCSGVSVANLLHKRTRKCKKQLRAKWSGILQTNLVQSFLDQQNSSQTSKVSRRGPKIQGRLMSRHTSPWIMQELDSGNAGLWTPCTLQVLDCGNPGL